MLSRIMSFRKALVLVAAMAAIKSLPAQSYGMKAMRDIMVTTRDGVKLATNVFLPEQAAAPSQRFPTIVERTPYNKDSVSPSLIEYYTTRGYAVAIQDVRGRYLSEGRWNGNRDDGVDGTDLLKWIAEQPWSNGKIGTMGTSYGGATQHALAIANAPNLTAMVPVDAMSNTGRYGVRQNGAFELRWLNWILTLGNATGVHATATGTEITANGHAAALRAAAVPESASAIEQMGSHIRDYASMLPLRPGTTPLQFAPEYETWFIQAVRHGDNDSFWKDSGISVVDHLADYKDIPIYHVTGWYDAWSGPVANINYAELAKAKKSPQRLIIGPWSHGGQAFSFSGIAEFGPEAAIDLNALRLRWYDHWLKNVANSVEKEPPVRLFVMGSGAPHKTPEGRLYVGGSWRNEWEWPLARAVSTPYYIHPDGSLSTIAPTASAPTSYRFDPADPVPTLGGNISSEGDLMLRGAQEQRCLSRDWPCKSILPLSARSDVLVYQTAPLAQDVEVTGRLIVKLWASSDGPDTDFTAKLVDVYPPNRDYPAGIELNIGDGILRARYRDSLEHPKPLAPGQATELTIEMYPTSLVFRRGHRIRLDISSSNFPRFDVNPNTGEPLGQERNRRVALNTVYHDRTHASRILLPIVPH
jgi:putative CocE/NonD family hydrolase